MSGISNFFKNFSEKVYKHFGQNSGNMLLVTSIIGTTLSSLAHIVMICFNDKYTREQKAYMIPQEIMECLVSATSIFVITKPLQRLAIKSVETGKLLPKNLLDYFKKNELFSKRGKSDFNLKTGIEKIITKIEESDYFIKVPGEKRTQFLKEHKDALNDLEIFQDSASAIASTAGAALSTAFVVPVIRNSVASYYQKINIEAYNNIMESRNRPEPQKIRTINPTFSRMKI